MTVPANRLCAEIHNGGRNPFRMPLIIRRDDESRWIDDSLKKPEIERFFQSFDANSMDAYPISGDFLKKRPGDASIIEPDADIRPPHLQLIKREHVKKIDSLSG